MKGHLALCLMACREIFYRHLAMEYGSYEAGPVAQGQVPLITRRVSASCDVSRTLLDEEKFFMPQSFHPRPLTFEDAMSVHVLRAHGMIFSELTRVFGANPARYHEILCGNLYPESWAAAVEHLASGRSWHPEVARLVEQLGLAAVYDALSAANPTKSQYQKLLKKLRKSAPIPSLVKRRVMPVR
jgi:hypothetical protein